MGDANFCTRILVYQQTAIRSHAMFKALLEKADVTYFMQQSGFGSNMQNKR